MYRTINKYIERNLGVKLYNYQENIKFLAKSFSNPQISPLQNTRKYSEDTALGK